MVKLNGEPVGYLGQLHPNIATRHDLPESYLFELKLAPIFKSAKEYRVRYEELPRYPAVTRDLAIVVDREITVSELAEMIKQAGKDLLESVTVFDVFAGEKIGEGKKSVAFSLVYRNPERTLTDEETNEIHQRIVTQLNERYGATLR